MEDLDQSLHDVHKKYFDGHLHIYDTSKVENLVIGRFKSIFFSSKNQPVCQVIKTAREIVLGESVIEQMTESIVAPKQGEMNSKWSQRKATLSSDYDILLTLLIPEPQIRKVEWDMRTAVANYLQPFLDQLEGIYDFDVKSQVLYLTSLGLSATQQMTDSKSGKIGNAIRQDDLGMAINMESRLISHVSSKPSFNFLAYVPTEAQSPLHIKAAEGTFLETNAFLVPRWGGVTIWNIDTKPNQTTYKIDERKFISIVTTQLRLLLGLRNDYKVQTLASKQGLSEWEKDFLLRMKLFENLMTSRVTLSSLAHLLSKISNIVITQEVAREVQLAVDSYDQAIACLASDKVESCYEFSTLSFKSSEHVFFDNTLLELLYFPEDQKYAIYVPLFLPIIFSFMSVLLPVLKEFKDFLKTKLGRS